MGKGKEDIRAPGTIFIPYILGDVNPVALRFSLARPLGRPRGVLFAALSGDAVLQRRRRSRFGGAFEDLQVRHVDVAGTLLDGAGLSQAIEGPGDGHTPGAYHGT